MAAGRIIHSDLSDEELDELSDKTESLFAEIQNLIDKKFNYDKLEIIFKTKTGPTSHAPPKIVTYLTQGKIEDPKDILLLIAYLKYAIQTDNPIMSKLFVKLYEDTETHQKKLRGNVREPLTKYLAESELTIIKEKIFTDAELLNSGITDTYQDFTNLAIDKSKSLREQRKDRTKPLKGSSLDQLRKQGNIRKKPS